MFYTYYQNNSGGYLYEDENVGKFVVIEGKNLHEIKENAFYIFEDYMDYCECCGKRWEDLGRENVYNTEIKPSILEEKNYYRQGGSIVIYYSNGTKEFHTHK